jgi:hypothetical protein
MSVAEWWRALTITFVSLNAVAGALVAQVGGNNPPASASLCEVLGRPAEYLGKRLVLSVRITATKDGASLWDLGCSNLGVSLVTDPEVRSEPGISELYRALRLHGLSDHPVTATLAGLFLEDRNHSIRHRGKFVFKAVAATAIRQSVALERR